MKRCIKCFMPDTRPNVIFNTEGVCQACLNYEKRKTVKWNLRKEELKKLCEKYRRSDGYYDCIIPVSGGKDSHFLVYMMKEEMKMNPLLITVGDPFTKSIAGQNNYRNLGETFSCDHILFDLSPTIFRKVTRLAFETFGEPLKFIETVIYTIPMKYAIQFGIPFVIFGENSAFEYGTTDNDNYQANETILNLFKRIDIDFWLNNGFELKEMNCIIPPTEADLKDLKPDVIFMSYFTPWSSTRQEKVAKRYGFKDLHHEWKREGYIEDFEQIDSLGYLIHLWLKYPKFGFQRTSDIASRRVREGLIKLETAKQLIHENDFKIDRRALDDFCAFCGYTIKQFWDIVEKFWNTNIFKKVDSYWILKDEGE